MRHVWKHRQGNYYCDVCNTIYTGPAPSGNDLQHCPKRSLMVSKEQITKNKFIASAINSAVAKGEGKPTLEDAIEEAKATLASNKEATEIFIYQVVKVVRKELPPVTVADVE